jgi:diguanylate cyclase (GGDEF)-like protein
MRDDHDIQTDGIPSALVYGEDEADDPMLAKTLVELTEQIAEALDCYECCIYDYLPERRVLRALAIWSRRLTQRDREWIGEEHPLVDIPDFERVISRREVVFSYPDDAVDAATSGFESMTYWGELAAIWAPIVHGDEVLGILELTEKERPRVFDDADKTLVRRMASLAAIALDNARVTRAVEERNRQLTALIDSSRAMISTLDLDEVLDVVCRQAALALDAGSSYIYEYDPETDAMVWLAEHQRDPDHGFEEPLGTVYPIADLPQDLAVVRTRRPAQVRLDDAGLDPVARQQLVDWEEQSSLMVPLVVGDAVVGTLEVSEAAYPRRFTDQEVQLCVALGEQAAVAIHNAQLYRRLQEQKTTIERQATTDGLTGLANHRHFWERLRDEVARARRYGHPLSLLMLDLDDFKSVNDRFGHLAGDRLLRAVGGVLREQVRKGVDLPARYGGEEFALILPVTESTLDDGTTPDGALTTAERIRTAVAELRPQVGDAEWTGITVSIGIATLPIHADGAEELVGKADQALYEAKRLGKDRVEIATPG